MRGSSRPQGAGVCLSSVYARITNLSFRPALEVLPAGGPAAASAYPTSFVATSSQERRPAPSQEHSLLQPALKFPRLSQVVSHPPVKVPDKILVDWLLLEAG